MTMTAPPRPPQPRDPLELQEIEDLQALIKEARERQRRRRRRMVATVAALLAVIGVSLSIVLGRSEPSQSASPAPPAPPPAAATPSAGEIVIHYDGRLPGRDGVRGGPGPGPPVHQLWVYADGRVIWRDENGPGYREQRLTPEGVELLRSELVSTGLFERDAEYSLSYRMFAMQVRNGGRLVTIMAPGEIGSTGRLPRFTGDVQAGARDRVNELLADPAFGLPASAWQDRAIRAYVPSKYAICFSGGDGFVHAAQAASQLPPAAQDLLRGKDTPYQLLLVKPFGWVGRWPAVCSELTTNEAQALSGILTTAGFRRERGWEGSDVYWQGQDAFLPDLPSDTDIWIQFEPILPHGQPRGMLG